MGPKYMRGVRDLGDLAQLAGPPHRVSREDESVAHVAGHDLRAPVAVEVEEARVRDDRHRHRGGRAQETPVEAARLGRGPGLRLRQRLRRACLEVRGEGVEVERRESAFAPRLQPDAPRLKRFMSCRRCRQSRRGASAGDGRTWHAAHSLRTTSAKAASGRVSGRPSRPSGGRRRGGGASGRRLGSRRAARQRRSDGERGEKPCHRGESTAVHSRTCPSASSRSRSFA